MNNDYRIREFEEVDKWLRMAGVYMTEEEYNAYYAEMESIAAEYEALYPSEPSES